MASIKVFDPVSVPFSDPEELQQLRALVEQLRRENWRLRGELDAARAGLDQAKRQAAPFSMGPPKPQPKGPGRKAGKAYGRHGHRLPISSAWASCCAGCATWKPRRRAGRCTTRES